MKGRPADHNHSDNVKSTKNNIDRTEQNIEFSNELMADTSDRNTRKEMDAKNKNREKALDQLHDEVRDKAKHHNPHS